jgi:glucose-1-phosphate cytidylyltransferase
MKAVILAGGLGTRLSEETVIRPKPMVEIGGRPILWHIMKIYAAHGISEFVICLGYKGYVIKEYFSNYALHMSDITIDLRTKQMTVHRNDSEDWKVSLIDTGDATMTGGRLRRVLSHVADDDFCLTYGDGVANIDIRGLVAFHRQHGGIATLTAVTPPNRYGHLDIVDNRVVDFHEKPEGSGNRINGGFFVVSPRVAPYLSADSDIWEREPLEQLAQERQLFAFNHDRFWYAMDTLRDKNYLEDLWARGNAPWKVW